MKVKPSLRKKLTEPRRARRVLNSYHNTCLPGDLTESLDRVLKAHVGRYNMSALVTDAVIGWMVKNGLENDIPEELLEWHREGEAELETTLALPEVAEAEVPDEAEPPDSLDRMLSLMRKKESPETLVNAEGAIRTLYANGISWAQMVQMVVIYLVLNHPRDRSILINVDYYRCTPAYELGDHLRIENLRARLKEARSRV